MTDKKRPAEVNDDIPGSEIEGHLQTEEHSGVEAIFDMGDYALSEDEKIAFGIHRLDITSPLDEADDLPPKDNPESSG